jgi:hypothetical protein
MKRCLASGRERFELWVGTAVLANNLMTIAALMNKRTLRKRRKTADVNSGRKTPKTRPREKKTEQGAKVLILATLSCAQQFELDGSQELNHPVLPIAPF